MNGLVSIPSSIINELLDNETYSKADALLDLLLMTDGADGVPCSERSLAKRWNWSRTKVGNFIRYLNEKSIFEPQESHKRATKNNACGPQDAEVYKRIVGRLNSKCGTRYKWDNGETIGYINDRISEGFTEQDFYTVIDKMSYRWIGTRFEEYLRPYTLFRKDKFEGYLNQKVYKRTDLEDINASRQSQLKYLLNSIKEDKENEHRRIQENNSINDDVLQQLPACRHQPCS